MVCLTNKIRSAMALVAACAGFSTGTGVFAETHSNVFGMPGIIDMPSAGSLADGRLGLTASYFAGQSRQTLTFQITPRLTGSFRYSILENGFTLGQTRYDRSFDLHFRLFDETENWPEIAIGVKDFIGTGFYGSEYLAATKSIGPALKFTGGIGWGRMGSNGGFANPLGIFGSYFDTRPVAFTAGAEYGGDANLSTLFRGPAALFAGATWQVSDRLSLSAEYSSDAYVFETSQGTFLRKSPLNFGAQYSPVAGITLGANYLYGSEVGVTLSFLLNPKQPPFGDRAAAPVPVRPRTGIAADWSAAWVTSSAVQSRIGGGLAQALATDGIVLQGLELSRSTARVRYQSTKFNSSPQAMGHIARILTVLMPPSVETFVLEPVVEGMTTARVTLQRSDLEELENAPDGSWSSFVRARIADPGRADDFAGRSFPEAQRLTWGVGPYFSTALFDPHNPLRIDVGAQLTTRYDLMAGLSITGVARLKALGNKDQSTRVSDSVLPHVRSDAYLYDKNDGVTIERLTLDYFTRPGRDLYARLSSGYLEPMFGGVSAELLWKPINSRLALGIEANYVKQRDFDKGLGFQDYTVATGHVSAYYNFGNGYEAQVDVGRYLAGDLGATLALDRTFGNGWKVGAYFTMTDVPFATFGEGSFDKGIHLVIPFSWIAGKPSQRQYESKIQPILRDGGARLGVANRLYEEVRGNHAPELQDQWGRFWR